MAFPGLEADFDISLEECFRLPAGLMLKGGLQLCCSTAVHNLEHPRCGAEGARGLVLEAGEQSIGELSFEVKLVRSIACLEECSVLYY